MRSCTGHAFAVFDPGALDVWSGTFVTNLVAAVIMQMFASGLSHARDPRHVGGSRLPPSCALGWRVGRLAAPRDFAVPWRPLCVIGRCCAPVSPRGGLLAVDGLLLAVPWGLATAGRHPPRCNSPWSSAVAVGPSSPWACWDREPCVVFPFGVSRGSFCFFFCFFTPLSSVTPPSHPQLFHVAIRWRSRCTSGMRSVSSSLRCRLRLIPH